MSYTVEWSRSATRELRAIPVDMAIRIATQVGHLGEDPRPPGCRKLVGYDDLWRIRVGRYRIIYFIGDAICLVRVERVGDRKDVYK